MSTDKTGGPAFPQDANVARAWGAFEHAKKPLSDQDYMAMLESLQTGMTLRDYFAAKAMLIMWEAYDKGYCGIAIEGESNNELIAEGAYQIADAMLKARQA